MSIENTSLPHNKQEVNIAANETADSSVINRSSNRLLANDEKLLTYIKNLANSLSGDLSISGDVLAGTGSYNVNYAKIYENLQLDPALVSGLVSLSSLNDVSDFTTAVDGMILRFDGMTSAWTPVLESTLNSNVSHVYNRLNYTFIKEYKDETQFIPVSAFSFLSEETMGVTSVTSTEQIKTFTFNLNNFNCPSIDITALEGLYIEASTFGRNDTVTKQEFKVEVLYPGNSNEAPNWRIINSHISLNQDDDGGSTNLTLVPIADNQTELKIRIVLPIGIENYSTTKANNKFAIAGALVRSANLSLFPDFETLHIKTTISSIPVSGSIDSTTTLDPTYDSWASNIAESGRFFGDLTNVLPIAANTGVLKTELEIIGNNGTTDQDPGVEVDLASCNINITYDWQHGKIIGTAVVNKGQLGTAVLRGNIGETVVGNTTDLGALDFVINTRADIATKQITNIPVPCDIAGIPLVNNLIIRVKHYNLRAGSGSVDSNAPQAVTLDLPIDNINENFLMIKHVSTVPLSASVGINTWFNRVVSGNVLSSNDYINNISGAIISSSESIQLPVGEYFIDAQFISHGLGLGNHVKLVANTVDLLYGTVSDTNSWPTSGAYNGSSDDTKYMVNAVSNVVGKIKLTATTGLTFQQIFGNKNTDAAYLGPRFAPAKGTSETVKNTTNSIIKIWKLESNKPYDTDIIVNGSSSSSSSSTLVSDGTPIGTIVMWPNKVKIPYGYAECNGAAYSKSTYSILHNTLKDENDISIYGETSTEFYIPDYRGMFLRGYTGESTNDPDAATRTGSVHNPTYTGNKVGTIQDSDIKSHQHDFDSYVYSSGSTANHIQSTKNNNGVLAPLTSTISPVKTFGGSETRPKNVSVIYIIKTK